MKVISKEMSETYVGTGYCFTEVREIIDRLNGGGIDSEQLTVCHGICLLEDTGKPYSHAWVEFDNHVFQFAIDGNRERQLIATPKLNFYKRSRLRDITRYSIKACNRMIKKLGHDGPWLKKYWELTRDKVASKRVIENDLVKLEEVGSFV